MKAITSAHSWALSTIFGMERWDVSSATLSVIADMPLVSAMAERVGARWFPDYFPSWRTQWQPAQVQTADRQLPAAGDVTNILRKYLCVQERPNCRHQRD